MPSPVYRGWYPPAKLPQPSGLKARFKGLAPLFLKLGSPGTSNNCNVIVSVLAREPDFVFSWCMNQSPAAGKPAVPRFAAADLRHFGRSLLVAAGLAEDRARVTAEVLLEGDLLGHTTHGLASLPLYLEPL